MAGKVLNKTMPIALLGLIIVTWMPVLPAHAEEDAPVLTTHQSVSVLFATNRKQNEGGDLDEYYNNEIGELSYGVCTVGFSPLKLLKDAAEHIPIRFPTEREEIVALENVRPGQFWPRLRYQSENYATKVVFYIHGYKMSFEKSCRRAALLQRELGPEVSLLLFAWPSQDHFAKYTHDETLLRRSTNDIKSVLTQMSLALGSNLTDVMAHSLGTRGVTTAIAELGSGDRPMFGELVLVAPDMDEQQFEDSLPGLFQGTSAITMYVSGNDSPLRVSREVHGEPRIGEAGEHLKLFEGVETIDITDVPQRDIYGHNYHYFNSRIIFDLRQLLTLGARAPARPGLQPSFQDGLSYWKMTSPM